LILVGVNENDYSVHDARCHFSVPIGIYLYYNKNIWSYYLFFARFANLLNILHRLGRIESTIRERNCTVEEQFLESELNNLMISIFTAKLT